MWVTLIGLYVATPGCAPRGERGGPPHTALTPRAPSPAPAPSNGPREVRLGSSVKGEPIIAYVFGQGPEDSAPVTTLILAAIHGDEPPAARVGRRLVEHLRENPRAAGGASVAVVPIVNPDGVAARTRTNANGVDCNRNLPASNWRKTRPGRTFAGPAPASEPETRAVMHAVAALRPRRVVSIHSPLRCNNYDGPRAAHALARLMASHNGYPVEATVGYATPGSFGTWAGIDQQIPVVTLELPGRGTTGDRAWQENRDALLAVIRAPKVIAVERYARTSRPGLSVRVTTFPRPMNLLNSPRRQNFIFHQTTPSAEAPWLWLCENAPDVRTRSRLKPSSAPSAAATPAPGSCARSCSGARRASQRSSCWAFA